MIALIKIFKTNLEQVDRLVIYGLDYSFFKYTWTQKLENISDKKEKIEGKNVVKNFVSVYELCFFNID